MMRQRTDDEILEDLKDWPVRNIYVERGVRLIEQLRHRVAELENERDKLLESLDTAVKAIIIFRNEPALERLHSLRSSNGYGVLQQAMDIGLDVITRVKGGAA